MAALDQPPPIICSIVQEEIAGWPCDQSARNAGNFSLRVIKNRPSGSSTIAQGRKFLNISERGNDSGEPSNRAWVGRRRFNCND
jgi:hypothetical protein